MLQSSDYSDKLFPLLLAVFFFRVLHVVDFLHNATDVLSPGLNAHAVSPADVKMTDRAPVVVPNVKQPVEDVVVVLCVQYDFILAVEDGSRFLVDGTACAKEA